MVLNPATGKKERIGRILQMHADKREEIKSIETGNIAAAVGLKGVPGRATPSATSRHPIVLERMQFPDPVISVAIEPRTTGGPDQAR